jgi:hypothetical protein
VCILASHEGRIDFVFQLDIVEIAPAPGNETDVFFAPYRLSQAEFLGAPLGPIPQFIQFAPVLELGPGDYLSFVALSTMLMTFA